MIMGLKYLFPLLAPFVLGVVFAGLCEPLVQRIIRGLKIRRPWAVAIVLSGLLFTVLAMITMASIAAYQEAERFIPKIPVLISRVLALGTDFYAYLGSHLPGLGLFFERVSKSSYWMNPDALNQVVQSLLNGFTNVLKAFPQFLVAIGLGGISAYFFSRDKELWSRLLTKIVPLNWRLTIIQIKNEMTAAIGGFLRAECALVLLTCILTVIFFKILGIRGALAYGLLAGFLDFLPVVGPGLIYLPLAFGFWLFKNPLLASEVIAVYLIVMTVRQITEFRLVGDSLNIHPLITLLILYLGMKLFGFAGIFFGPVLIITMRASYKALIDKKIFA